MEWECWLGSLGRWLSLSSVWLGLRSGSAILGFVWFASSNSKFSSQFLSFSEKVFYLFWKSFLSFLKSKQKLLLKLKISNSNSFTKRTLSLVWGYIKKSGLHLNVVSLTTKLVSPPFSGRLIKQKLDYFILYFARKLSFQLKFRNKCHDVIDDHEECFRL